MEDLPEDNNETWEQLEAKKEAREMAEFSMKYFLAKLAKKDDIEADISPLEIRENLLTVIDELSELLGSLEHKRNPENTADHYAEYYFPIIERLRKAEDIDSILEIFREIKTEDMIHRFYECIKKQGTETRATQGNFPMRSDEFLAFQDVNTYIILYTAYKKDLKDLSGQ